MLSRKKSLSTNNTRIHAKVKNVEIILLDVEGTTSPISFVTETLFPYVKENLEGYIRDHLYDDKFQGILKDLRKLAEDDKSNEVDGIVDIPVSDDKDVLINGIVANIKWQMSHDRKTKPLKDLQGQILHEGFTQGHLKSQMYDDVIPVLKQLVNSGKKLCVYSSGSILAQKLVFAHTEDIELKEHISGYYDTTVGAKTDPGSYKKIAEDSGATTENIVFITDTPQEAQAAEEAGMKTILSVRHDTKTYPDSVTQGFSCIDSFSELIDKDLDDHGGKKARIEKTEHSITENGEDKSILEKEAS